MQALLRGDIDFLIDTVVIPYVERERCAASPRSATAACRPCPIFRRWLTSAIPTSARRMAGPARARQTAAEVVATLNRHLAEIFNDSAFLDRLAKVGVWPRYRPSSALDLDLREDNDYFGGIIRRYKIGGQSPSAGCGRGRRPALPRRAFALSLPQLRAICGARGRSSMVERQLPKLHTRVRFPSPAPTLSRFSVKGFTGSFTAFVRVSRPQKRVL